jgi:hypothetical protein
MESLIVLAKLQAEHVRLCLNALTLMHDTGANEVYLKKAAEAAINTIQLHVDISKSPETLSYSVDVSQAICVY